MAIHRFAVVGSTNDVALEMARNGAEEGTIVIADQQTAGKGRRGRVWQSEPGQSVLMSVVLRPAFPVSEISRLSFVAALAVSRLLAEQCRLRASLKWPNDIYIGDRKLGGILIEIAQGAAVVGIGLNVNQRRFLDDLQDSATSVLLETGQTYNSILLSESLAQKLIEEYQTFLRNGFEHTLLNWRQQMRGIDRHVVVDIGNETIKGTIQGVDDNGALLVKDEREQIHSIHAADAIKTTTN